MKHIIAVFMFFLILIAALIFNSASSSASDHGMVDNVKQIVVTAPDSLQLHGWLHQSAFEREAPLIVLLPMMAKTHDSYDPFIAALEKYLKDDPYTGMNPPHYLALDLRGHGLSQRSDTGLVKYDQMKVDDFAKVPGDVALMIENLMADDEIKVDSTEIYLIGASIGANSAALATEQINYAAKLVLLSPGDDYRGLKPTPAIEAFNGKTLIFASVDDRYAAQSSNNISLAKAERCKLELFAGHDHGTNIINNDPAAMTKLIEWLMR
ncbi:MAG: alpha/beta fold hydrolase [bacterium]|nr:alpha/beta fold hydrolase [bacterium]